MGVSRKAGVGSQGERQSKVVEQFAAGFVASSSATDAEKATQRDWDRSQLLAVKDDDAQVQIYNAYAERSNTDGEGKNSRRGLGSGGGGASSSSGFGRGMSFVKAGGAPAPAPAPAAAAGASAAGASTAVERAKAARAAAAEKSKNAKEVAAGHRPSAVDGAAPAAAPAGEPPMQVFTVVAPAGPLGIGLTSGNGGYVCVGDVQAGSAAGASGVTVGCKLVTVNGQSTKGLMTKEVTDMLRAAAAQGQPRTLEFARA